MKPLFTIHGGEFLVGSYIERHFKRVNVWIPTKDTGIDFLVSDPRNRRAISLQVKYSKDFLVTHMGAEFQDKFRATGWWTLSREKMETSRADFWVFVLAGFSNRSFDYVIISPKELLERLKLIHGMPSTFQTYLWVTGKEMCWEARGLKKSDHRSIAAGSFADDARNFTRYLADWSALERLNE